MVEVELVILCVCVWLFEGVEMLVKGVESGGFFDFLRGRLLKEATVEFSYVVKMIFVVDCKV